MEDKEDIAKEISEYVAVTRARLQEKREQVELDFKGGKDGLDTGRTTEHAR